MRVHNKMPTKLSGSAKERHRGKLLQYLGNPENEVPARCLFSTEILGLSNGEYIYQVFTPDELAEIEREALEIRRKKYATLLSNVDRALYNQCLKGDPQAIKLFYQRFENWSERKTLAVEVPTLEDRLREIAERKRAGRLIESDPVKVTR